METPKQKISKEEVVKITKSIVKLYKTFGIMELYRYGRLGITDTNPEELSQFVDAIVRLVEENIPITVESIVE